MTSSGSIDSQIAHYIAYREDSRDLNYYLPVLFNSNRFYIDNLPILIHDLIYYYNKSVFLIKNYYKNCNTRNFILINNHPLKNFIISGTIISIKTKLINNKDFLLLKIDDNSCFKLNYIQFKCPIDVLHQFQKKLSIDNLLNANVSCIVQKSNYQTIFLLEFDIIELISINVQLKEQLIFWKSCMIEKKILLNNKWSPDVTKETEKSKDTFFLQNLQSNEFKENLQITSPFSTSSNLNLPSIDTDLLDLNNTDVFVVDSNPIEITTEKQLQMKFVEIMTSLPTNSNKIDLLNLYESQFSQKCLNNFAKFKFQQKHLNEQNNYDLDTLKKNEFNSTLQKLFKQGLIKFQNNNTIIDIISLQKLFQYSLKRMKLLIKLNCLIGTIDIDFILSKLLLSNEKISIIAIINLFKLALNHITSETNNVIKNWWVEKKSDSIWLIHLFYK